ncbi:hypothetical protein DL769_011692 [Monosporascus sp. CRB-8-3]|nr:hypothetical protein DL769_011692 [Monosporascus sp. CRB-8-3]
MSPRAFCFLILTWLWTVSCLQVTPNSECAALCLDQPNGNVEDSTASSTNSSDIVCRDGDYSSKPTGIKFKNCLNCLQESTAVSGDESDVLWFLHNIRFAVDVCLFGFPRSPDAISSPCDIDHACGPLGEALRFDTLDSENGADLGYCTAANGVFKDSSVEACYQCLQTSPEQNYFANFMIALNAGCKQTPEAGALLGLQGSLFSQAQINITDPLSNVTLPGDDNPATGMTTGTIIGIAIGAALLLLGGISLFVVHRRRERRYNKNTSEYPDFDAQEGNGPNRAPIKGGFASVDYKSSPSMMSDYELRAQMAYTNNAEFYDDLEKMMHSQRQNYHLDPHSIQRGAGSALPTHPAYVPRAMDRVSSRSAIPEVPRPVKYQKPDSYALQQYLEAGEDAVSIHLPPPPPRTAASSRESNRSPSSADSATTNLLQAARPPPPPPLAKKHSKVPSLSLPSVPQIRIPKRYSPPQIQVQTATPIGGASDDDNSDSGISKPLTTHERRFQDHSGYGGDRQPHPLQSNAHIVEQQAQAWPRLGGVEADLQTGKSSFYG